MEFAEINEGLRTGLVDPPDPVAFAANLLKDSGLDPLPEDARRLSQALDAVNCAVKCFAHMSKNPSYDFNRHENN